MIYYVLSILSGLALTLQAGLNGQLREKFGNPVISSLISFFVGTIVLLFVYIFLVANKTYSFPKTENISGLRIWMFFGGFLGAFYLFTTIFASAKIGFSNMFSLIICGQILLAVLFDHFGILTKTIHEINPPRILGTILLVSGVYIIQKF